MTDAANRAKNVVDSVAVSDESKAHGKRIILIDDVATTGSTLDACASALKECGATSVWCLTLAVAGRRSTRE